MSNQGKWVLDPMHSEVQFKVKHLVISTVTGTFNMFDGSLVSETEDFSGAQIDFSLDVNSVYTNQTDRDNHLKSADFFDAEKFQAITFKSTSVEKDGSDYLVKGNLTIKDVTKPVKLNAEFGGIATDPWGNTKAGFKIVGKINRFDYGLKWNTLTEAGGAVVGQDVDFKVNLQLVKPKK